MSNSEPTEINDYILQKDIGEGNFGKVKLGISKTTGKEYAVKVINKDQIKIKMKNKIFKENEVITKFNHINVIFVFEILEDENNYYIIMEYCKRGELFDYIVDNERLTEDEASIFFYQLINGVEYIHSKGFAHRDLKPENLLLTKDKTLKIIDFGLSHEFDGSVLLKTKCGSPSYASPEILKGKPYDGFKTDIWCCGIILFAMICGYLPFDGDNNKILFKNIIECKLNIPDYLDESTQELIKRILVAEPNERITIDEIKKHKFYLRGKKLCHFDYKTIEKNVLSKRKNKSSFRLNENDNTYFIAENDDNDSDNVKIKKQNKMEDNILNEIIKEAEDDQIKDIKDNNTEKEKETNENQSIYTDDLINKNENIYDDSNCANSNNKREIHSFREMLLNNNTNTKYEDNKESQNRINSIFVSKVVNIGNNGFNELKNNTNRVKENSKNSKLNKFLQNFGKNLKINADINEKNILQQKGETNRNNKFIPTMILNENNYHFDEHENNNSTFSRIKNNFIKNDYLINKHKILLNFGNNKNDNLSIDHYNDKINFKNKLYGSNNDKIKNKINPKEDVIFSNSFHQLKLINGKSNLRTNNYLYCNNINININNYNIKTGNNINEKKYNKRSHTHLNINTENINKNLMNGKYINFNRISNKIISSNSNEAYMQNINNKNHSIGKLDGSKKVYFKRGNLLNIDTNNNNNENSFKTQQNFYKPRNYFNFDKISFHSSSNKKQVLNRNNNLRFKEKNSISRIDDFKRRGGSEGRASNHSKLDRFLVENNGFYKNKNRRRNQLVYFFNPININEINNNNVNQGKQNYLPLMTK